MGWILFRKKAEGVSLGINEILANSFSVLTDVAAHECVSPEALANLKSYKYSSVDKSYVSYYILRHYVRKPLHPYAQRAVYMGVRF